MYYSKWKINTSHHYRVKVYNCQASNIQPVYLARILDKLMPLRLELFAGSYMNLPVFIVFCDQVFPLWEMRQDCLDNNNCSSCVQFLIRLHLEQTDPNIMNKIISTKYLVQWTIFLEQSIIKSQELFWHRKL